MFLRNMLRRVREDPFALMRCVDLTHTLHPGVPSWSGSCGFEHQCMLDYDACTTDPPFRVQRFALQAGIGTHMDAPAHCIPGGADMADLPVETFLAPLCVIDLSDGVHERTTLSLEGVRAFEAQFGMAKGAFVIVHTGWGRFWGEAEKYRNNHVFPSVSAAAAEFLLEREIVGLGIDTLSPDRPEDGFPVHKILLGAGKYIVENVANAGGLPPTGAYSIALPLKIAGATESPIRLIALLPQSHIFF